MLFLSGLCLESEPVNSTAVLAPGRDAMLQQRDDLPVIAVSWFVLSSLKLSVIGKSVKCEPFVAGSCRPQCDKLMITTNSAHLIVSSRLGAGMLQAFEMTF